MSTFGPLTPNAMRYEVYIATVEEKLGNLSNVDLANVLLVCTEAYQKQPFESLPEEIQHTLIYVCYYHNILVIVYIISYKLVVIIYVFIVFIVYSHIVYASLT